MGRKVFMSYARRDSNYVNLLIDYLRLEKVEVWHDSAIRVGEKFPAVLERKIAECSAVIVVLTPAACESEWVAREIDLAAKERKEILPLLLERCALPPALAHIHHESVIGQGMPSPHFVQRLRMLVDEPKGQRSLPLVGRVTLPKARSITGAELTFRRSGRPFPVEGLESAFAMSRDGELLAAGGADGIALWDLRTGALMWRAPEQRAAQGPFTTPKDPVNALAFAPDGRALVAVHPDSIKVWKVKQHHAVGELLIRGRSIRGRSIPRQGLCFSPDGKRLAIFGGSRILILKWKNNNLIRRALLADPSRPKGLGDTTLYFVHPEESSRHELRHLSSSLSFSKDGEVLVISTKSDPPEVVLWRPVRQKTPEQAWWGTDALPLYCPLTFNGWSAETLTFSPNNRLVAMSAGGYIGTWDLHSRRAIGDLVEIEGRIVRMQFFPDGEALFTQTDDGVARINEVMTGRLLGIEQVNWVIAVKLDARRVVSWHPDHSLQLWTLS